MENENAKNYPLYCIIICFGMILLLGITPFLPAFQVEVFGAQMSEKGVDFLTPSTTESKEIQIDKDVYTEYKQTVSYKSEFIGDFEDYEFWSGVIYICQIAIFIVAFAALMASFGACSAYNNRNYAKVIKDIKLNTWILLAPCAVNYATFLYLLSKLVLCKTYKVLPATGNTDSAPITVSTEESIALIAKYKELLDNGIITEEEFNSKKNELL